MINDNQTTKTLVQLKNEGVKYLSKWSVVDSQDKLNTILAHKLYAGYSSGFNDAFDSQIRLSQKDKLSLAYDMKIYFSKQMFRCVLMNEQNAVKHYLGMLEQQLDMFHSTNIACFSELYPLNLESNHMWGLYGNSGAGIVLCYSIDDLIEYEKTPLFQNSHYSFYNVYYGASGYEQNYRILKDYLSTPNSLSMTQELMEKDTIKFLTMLTTKTYHWQYEKEWRFVGHSPNNLFDFIKPKQIIFGWNNKQYREQQKKLVCNDDNKEYIDYYQNIEDMLNNDNDIEFIYLDNTIDYTNSKFNIR